MIRLQWNDDFLQKKIWGWPQLHIEIEKHEKKINFKINQVMEYRSKTRSTHLLLKIDFNNKI